MITFICKICGKLSSKYGLQRNHPEWYKINMTKEQLKEYKRYINDEIDEPKWINELGLGIIKNKCGNG